MKSWTPCALCPTANVSASPCGTTWSCPSRRSPTTIGVSANSVKTHLKRGLRSLAATLEGSHELTLESRLYDALGDAGAHSEPSPDLFERVVGSIADDRVRRRHLRRVGSRGWSASPRLFC